MYIFLLLIPLVTVAEARPTGYGSLLGTRARRSLISYHPRIPRRSEANFEESSELQIEVPPVGTSRPLTIVLAAVPCPKHSGPSSGGPYPSPSPVPRLEQENDCRLIHSQSCRCLLPVPGTTFQRSTAIFSQGISAVLPPGGVPLIHYDGHVNPEMAQEAPRARGLVDLPGGWNKERMIDWEYKAGLRWKKRQNGNIPRGNQAPPAFGVPKMIGYKVLHRRRIT